MYFNIEKMWPETREKITLIDAMFDRQMERAKQEDLRRECWREKQARIQSLHELLTLQEMEFIISLVKIYHKFKKIFC
jgi:hypothetical protein